MKAFLLKKIILSLLIFLIFPQSVSAVSCSMDFWRGDYGLHNSNYKAIGAWFNGPKFELTLNCNPANPPEPYCIGWRQNAGGCVNPDASNYLNGGRLGWELTAPGSGGNWCISAWVREKSGGICLDNTSIYPNTGSLRLWSSGHAMTSLIVTISSDATNTYLDYYVKLSGNAFSGEYAELRKGGGGFCGPKMLGAGKDFSCRKTIPKGTDTSPYTGVGLCAIVADNRASSNCLIPTVNPIVCNASFTPSSGSIAQGDTFDFQGKVNSVSGGNGSGIYYAWITKNYGPLFTYPPTVDPTKLGVWVPGRWNPIPLAPGNYTVTFLARNGNEGWNKGVFCSGGALMTITPGVPVSSSPWFQVKGGDVHAVGNITSLIPVTATEKAFNTSVDGYPGLVSFTGSADFRPANIVSSTNWLANSSNTGLFSYDSYYRKLGSPTIDNFTCTPQCPAVSGVYYSDSTHDAAVNKNWNIPSGVKIIVLVDQNLNIQKEISVPVGSFLAFFVKGNINIEGQVGDQGNAVKTGINANLQGVFYTDGTIDTYSNKETGLGSGNRFVGAGSFFASHINLKRDLKGGALSNSTNPAELFISRPDLIINAPSTLFSSSFSWQEVAP